MELETCRRMVISSEGTSSRDIHHQASTDSIEDPNRDHQVLLRQADESNRLFFRRESSINQIRGTTDSSAYMVDGVTSSNDPRSSRGHGCARADQRFSYELKRTPTTGRLLMVTIAKDQCGSGGAALPRSLTQEPHAM